MLVVARGLKDRNLPCFGRQSALRLKCWRQPAADTALCHSGKMSTVLYLQTEVMILKSSSTNCCTLPGQTSLFNNGIWGGFAGVWRSCLPCCRCEILGSAQRRKRVYAVADTGGESANEILFDRKGDEWNFRTAPPGGKALPDLLTTAIAGMKEWYRRNPPGVEKSRLHAEKSGKAVTAAEKGR